jgi:Mg2+ and Co2+ transporter CorA
VREYIAAVVMIVFTSICFWGMNVFGFQNNPHDILWTLGAALALLIILLVNVYIYFVICKESPWVWKKED